MPFVRESFIQYAFQYPIKCHKDVFFLFFISIGFLIAFYRFISYFRMLFSILSIFFEFHAYDHDVFHFRHQQVILSTKEARFIHASVPIRRVVVMTRMSLIFQISSKIDNLIQYVIVRYFNQTNLINSIQLIILYLFVQLFFIIQYCCDAQWKNHFLNTHALMFFKIISYSKWLCINFLNLVLIRFYYNFNTKFYITNNYINDCIMADIQQIRSTYKNLQQLCKNNQALKINNVNVIQQNKVDVENAIKDVQRNNDFQKIQELLFYQQKYQQLGKVIKQSKQKLTPPTKYQSIVESVLKINPPIKNQMNQIYKQSKQVQQGSGEADSEQISELVSFKPLIKHTSSQVEIKDNSNETDPKVTIANFFLNKENQARKKRQKTFKSLLKSVPQSQESIRSSAFKKKSRLDKDAQIRKLMQENQKIHEELSRRINQEKQINEFQKKILKQEKEKCVDRIEQLQAQIQHLSRFNFKLKQQKSEVTHNYLNEGDAIDRSFQQRSHTFEIIPYNIPMKPNNLQKISQKNGRNYNSKHKPPFHLQNYNDPIPNQLDRQQNFNRNPIPTHFLDSKAFEQPRPSNYACPFVSNQQPIPARENNYIESPSIDIKQRQLFNLLNASNYSQRKSQFQTFDMARTLNYENNSDFLNASRKETKIDSKTSTRNKVAFFKKSLVIVRNHDFQIAFKKSDVDETLSHIRIIFYILNKTHQKHSIRMEYDYQPSYFNIKFQERTFQVKPQQQARQSLLVSLIHKENLNSVIDLKVTIGHQKYDLWVPISFIKITNEPTPPLMSTCDLTVDADRQFSSFENMNSIVPLLYEGKEGDAVIGHFYGVSKYFSGGVRLTWFQNQVTIETSEKWLDFIGFILHRYK